MKYISILSFWLLPIVVNSQSMTFFPDRIETSATGTIKVKINNIDQLRITKDSVNFNATVGTGTRYITTTPNGRLTTITTTGTGVNGLNTYQGTTVPANSLGVAGETYINTTNWDFYKKISSAWSIQGNIKGATGLTGATGSQGIQGTTGAAGATGATGSQGIQGATGLTGATGSQGIQGAMGATGSQGIQGATGATGSQGIQGIAGTNGATWRNASGLPSNSLGIDGDFYLDNTSPNTYYKRVSGAYVSQGTLRGLTGATGSQGIQGATGLTGATGLQGIQGITGSMGVNGIDGLNVYQGNATPLNSLGVNGETYLNTTTWNVSKKILGAWVIVGNIQGTGNSIPSNGYTNIPALMFNSATLTNAPVYNFSKGTVYFLEGIFDNLKTAINLPDKATINSISAAVIDNSFSDNIQLTLYRSANSAIYSEVISTAKTGGASGSDTMISTLTLPVASLIIDNATYQYYIIAEPLDAINNQGRWRGNGLEIKNIVINYQY